jgi:hypothetical protein
MKVEQRIGRIDRLGQLRPVVRVLSFAYKDTVEQDVFFTVGSRINLFQGIVGRLQPILSRLPRGFEELALLDKDAREAARQRFLADLEQQVRNAGESGFDIDATVEDSLDLPALPEPALTDLDRAIQISRARPPEVEFRPLDAGSYGIGLPGCESGDDRSGRLRVLIRQLPVVLTRWRRIRRVRRVRRGWRRRSRRWPRNRMAGPADG